MSNSYFQFKQFTVHQDRCSMKVSTDACILGAWAPVKGHVNNVLDIGCGTGLLSLMLAQRDDKILIDALEIDEQAIAQAAENTNASAWKNRILTIHADARSYLYNKQYDMVICNPPFFNNSLLGPDSNRNAVRHTLSMNYTELFTIINRVISPNGYAAVLLPVTEHEVWADVLRENNWYIETVLHVKPRTDKLYNRVVSICVPYPADTRVTSLQIYNDDSSYTAPFSDLLRPFYLNI